MNVSMRKYLFEMALLTVLTAGIGGWIFHLTYPALMLADYMWIPAYYYVMGALLMFPVLPVLIVLPALPVLSILNSFQLSQLSLSSQPLLPAIPVFQPCPCHFFPDAAFFEEAALG